MIAVADETVGPAMRRGPRDRLLQRLQGQLLRVMVAARARPTIRLANTSVTNAAYAKRPSAMRT